MDPTGIGRGTGGFLSGLAKVITALRSGPPFEVEAKYLPETLSATCCSCGRPVDHGNPERIFVMVHALTSGHYLRVRAAGICHPNPVVRKIRQWTRKPAWHEIAVKPVGGVDSPRFDRERLRRFGERRDLPATVMPENPLSFNLILPEDLPPGIKRGYKLRVWVGRAHKGGIVSDPIDLPIAQPSEAPKQCHSCSHRQSRPPGTPIDAPAPSAKSASSPAPPRSSRT